MRYVYQAVAGGWRRSWRQALLLALLLGSTLGGWAQSGPYGNEWLVPGQPYYKVKVWRNGLYRLDFAYLSKLGAGATAPAQLQLWRRGREVAVYQGGNSAALDASTFLEFYGQRNDGALDRDYYKDSRDQANPHFSFFTDTAAYFITWGSRPGKRMAQPAAAGGTPHAWRLQTALKLHVDGYLDAPSITGVPNSTFMPWLEAGEGFFSGLVYQRAYSTINDSVLRAVATTATTLPRAEVVISGSSNPINGHHVVVRVVPPSGTQRALGQLNFPDFTAARGKYALQFSDIRPDGLVELNSEVYQNPPSGVGDGWRYAYSRLVVPQQVVWFSNRASVAFQNDSLLAGPATYEVDGVPTAVAGFDVHDPWNVQRVAPAAAQTLGATARRYVFPSATEQQTRRLLLADESRPLTPAPAQRITFRTIDPAKPNFIIITHPALQKASGAAPNAAKAYAAYRASAAGGRYDTLMVTAPLLYDQFHYGERSVLALRHFALWMGDKSPATQAKYLLLLGKGISPGAPLGTDDYGLGYFGVPAGNTTRFQGEAGLDLVPTTTRTPSDLFLSNDWPHDNYTPRLITGRLVAQTPAEVMAYLGKMQEYELSLANNLDAWHKNVVQLVGGHSAADFAEFGGYMDYYKKQISSPLFGGNVTTYRRTATDVGTVPFPIPTQVNAGLQLISYFGHGSPNYAELQIGDIKDVTIGYNNAGRYPIMLYSGCGAGACFFPTPTFGSDWVLAASKGAIGMLAETGFSYAYLIHPMEQLSNQLLFNDATWFGRPLAEVQHEVIRRLPTLAPTANFNNSFYANNSPEAVQQLQTQLWQGDPALRLFAPPRPDLIASNATLSIAPVAGQPSVMATSTSFVLNVGVSNPARITRDSVEIRVTRRYPDNTTATYLFNGLTPSTRAFPQAFGRDTVYAITLPNAGNVFGDNVFTVDLDYRNKIAELSETNNTATLHFAFLQSGITLLAPAEFGVVNSSQPRLVAQSNNLNEVLRGYDVQVDSVATFDSRALKSGTVTANTVVSYVPPALLSARDSTVWYWRVRFSAPSATEDKSWVSSSFRVIGGAVAGGWSQSHNGQFRRDQLQGVAVAAPTNRWSFQGQPTPMQLRTAGGGLPGSSPTFLTAGGTIFTDISRPPYVSDCGVDVPNLLAVVLDHNTLQRITVPGTGYSTCGQGAQTFYHFAAGGDTLRNLNSNQAYRDLLSRFMASVPDGAYVLLVSENRLRFADPALAGVRQLLATTLGSKLIGQLKNGEPWAIVAEKQASGGRLLRELGPDASLGTPTYSQQISLTDTLRTVGTSGQVLSTIIGPARQWQSLFTQIKRESSTSAYTLSLVGIDAANNETVLNADIKAKRLDLSGFSATTYPRMRLKLTLRDSVNRVPPQLRQWLLSYRGLPEGIVRRDLVAAAAYDAATLTKQAVNDGYLHFPVKFDNVAPDPFAQRLQLQVSLYDANNKLLTYPGTTTPVQTLLTAPRDLGAGDSVLTFPAALVRLKVIGVFGTFTPVAVVNPQLQPEQNYFNNELRLPPITVADTNVPPTLDVAVDGRHILNGELVSPTPIIAIQLKDEDRLRAIKDASYFTVYLQRDGQVATRVTDASLLHFTVDSTSQKGSVAKLEYYPGKTGALPDGVYTLRVQGRDPSGASSGTQDYQVKFEVVQASSITNVFPYPNPITSKAKFVFTVTGDELPRNMKIQIMTLTGKVVREIFMAELGPLHIGNNLTDYAWDGTDQYGDRLANGTYLYRVLLDDPGSKFTQRATAGDKSFKNDWGKLVLLR
ncbi:MAG: C25 family cysteine peptidase [Janthinobacterium lividum]